MLRSLLCDLTEQIGDSLDGDEGVKREGGSEKTEGKKEEGGAGLSSKVDRVEGGEPGEDDENEEADEGEEDEDGKEDVGDKQGDARREEVGRDKEADGQVRRLSSNPAAQAPAATPVAAAAACTALKRDAAMEEMGSVAGGRASGGKRKFEEMAGLGLMEDEACSEVKAGGAFLSAETFWRHIFGLAEGEEGKGEAKAKGDAAAIDLSQERAGRGTGEAEREGLQRATAEARGAPGMGGKAAAAAVAVAVASGESVELSAGQRPVLLLEKARECEGGREAKRQRVMREMGGNAAGEQGGQRGTGMGKEKMAAGVVGGCGAERKDARSESDQSWGALSSGKENDVLWVRGGDSDCVVVDAAAWRKGKEEVQAATINEGPLAGSGKGPARGKGKGKVRAAAAAAAATAGTDQSGRILHATGGSAKASTGAAHGTSAGRVGGFVRGGTPAGGTTQRGGAGAADEASAYRRWLYAAIAEADAELAAIEAHISRKVSVSRGLAGSRGRVQAGPFKVTVTHEQLLLRLRDWVRQVHEVGDRSEGEDACACWGCSSYTRCWKTEGSFKILRVGCCCFWLGDGAMPDGAWHDGRSVTQLGGV